MIDLTDESRIPPHIRTSLDDYMDKRWQPGGFVTAVLENDLKGAFGRADHLSMAAMPAIVAYVYWKLPSISQGSPEKVKTWLGDNYRES